MWTVIFIVLNAMIVGVGVYQAIRQFRGGKNIARTILVTVSALVVLNGLVAILNTLISSKTQEELAQEIGSIKEEQREHRVMLGEVLEYFDGLPETKNPKLKRLFKKGYALYKEERYPEAIDTFKACLQLKTKDSERLALLLLIGNAYRTTVGNLKEVEDSYQEARLIGERIGDKQGTASALGNIGVLYQHKGDLDQALRYHQDALKIHRETGYRQGEASQSGNIGLVYQTKGDLDQALEHFQQVLAMERELGRQWGEANALGNIGVIYHDKGDLDQALKYQKEALDINREIGYREGKASDLSNIGVVYQAKSDLDQALKYLNEALKIFEQIKIPEKIEKTKRNIERISQQIEQMERNEK